MGAQLKQPSSADAKGGNDVESEKGMHRSKSQAKFLPGLYLIAWVLVGPCDDKSVMEQPIQSEGRTPQYAVGMEIKLQDQLKAMQRI